MNETFERTDPVPITALQVLWGSWAIVGLIGVAWPAAHVPEPAAFVRDIWKMWSTVTVSVDLVFLGLAAVVFAVIESRRLGMPWPWIWVPLGIVLPGAFLIPLFFLLRERAWIRLNRTDGVDSTARNLVCRVRGRS
jgi:Terpene cyclase DEP1